MQKATIFAAAVAMIVSFSAPLFAYETIEVKDGGTIEGVVEYAGRIVPKDIMLTVSSDTEFCGKSLPAKKYLIKDRKIENAIVYITEIKAGKAIPDRAVDLTSAKCSFVPRIAVAFKGNKIIMNNDDPLLHTFDIHASISGKEVFHVNLHEKGSSVTKLFSKAGLMELTCYVHPWQHAFVYVFDHPYAVVTDENGKFVIKDVPPGTYAVEVWHEALGMQKVPNVKVERGQTSAVKLEYTKEIKLY